MNRLSKENINKICSSQAIVTLAGAVKELLENSLDAGATSIEIRMVDWGVDSLIILDNGSGIRIEDHKNLCLKGCTNKIFKFEDIESAETYGFRGEALSALSALSDLEVITCQQPPVGYKLIYDHSGTLKNCQKMARSKGTTVYCRNLFACLPVRHHEFKKNSKKSFNEALKIVYSYCLSQLDVRFTLSNSIDGSKTIFIQTSGVDSLQQKVSSLFGISLASNGIEVDKKGIDKGKDSASVRGIISKPKSGCGKNDTEIQYLFINNRPSQITRLKRMLNQLYHEYNPNQYPWYILFLTLSENKLDRNVSPDKQALILENEDSLISDLRQIIDDIFNPYRGEFGTDKSNKKIEPFQSLITGSQKTFLKKSSASPLSKESDMKLFPFRRSMALDSPFSLKTNLTKIKQGKKFTASRYEFSSRNLETPFFIHKTDFGSMKVIGQFNLGFILVSFHSHLFIVDQHASDEKYLYENFRDETKIISQNLISPKKLFLTPQNQFLVEKYQEQLKNQGFIVSSRNSNWTLDAVPYIKHVAFNTADLDELIHEMASQPLILPLCKRMNSVFASKACRAAVMIGDPLSHNDMKKIISNMENIKQPWNCPHGRPTLRFLCNYKKNHDSRENNILYKQ